MKTTQNTVLITGGSAGIGFEIARQLLEAGNTVIITGRNTERLAAAASSLPGVHTFNGDIANADDTAALVAHITNEFPQLNIVINNAGAAFLNNFVSDGNAFEKAAAEMHTNYLSVIRLNELLLPALLLQPAAAIVNVSSVAAFVPLLRVASYSATKAAVHSYTVALRAGLTGTGIRVFELMPPLVNTEFSKGIDGHKGIPPQQVATEFMQALSEDKFEIRVANTEALYDLYRSSPADALHVINESRNVVAQ
ncbi:SDR family oxidoreductase [Chitinophaga sp. Cy-1792]|uniref:SDR family oxidoreductase n=1 Tax=Chitinophaga sp. Cy-1792 TaxID=2608339 RepID=UPI001422C43E|nr:SDR family NAD(P)-dependent oxidoreductase [Chitinophaga sp. Cy-1792]NIG55136.1 SDR family NAD(P)-dependent oxidoreductase [Chitinophaga sp. Cy-1792]